MRLSARPAGNSRPSLWQRRSSRSGRSNGSVSIRSHLPSLFPERYFVPAVRFPSGCCGTQVVPGFINSGMNSGMPLIATDCRLVRALSSGPYGRDAARTVPNGTGRSPSHQAQRLPFRFRGAKVRLHGVRQGKPRQSPIPPTIWYRPPTGRPPDPMHESIHKHAKTSNTTPTGVTLSGISLRKAPPLD